MRGRLPGLLLVLALLVTAPGCRVLAGAAVIAGEIAIDVLIDDEGGGDHDDNNDCDDHPAKHSSGHRTHARRAPSEATTDDRHRRAQR